MGAQSSSLAEPNPKLAAKQRAKILALLDQPPKNADRVKAIKKAGTHLTSIQTRLDNVVIDMAEPFYDFTKTSEYLTTIYDDVTSACMMNIQHQPFTIFFTLEPDQDKKRHVATTLFTPFCQVILLRFLLYKQWIDTYQTLVQVENAFQSAAKTGFKTNAGEFDVLQRIATLQPLDKNVTMSLDAFKPYFVFTDAFPETTLQLLAPNNTQVVLAAYPPSEHSVHQYLNYLVHHWKRLENVNGFLDKNVSTFFEKLHNIQAEAIQKESTFRDQVSTEFVEEQTVRLSKAEALPAFLQPPVQGAPRVLVLVAATHGFYWTKRQGDAGEIEVNTSTVPYNMTLTKVPLVQPGLSSYQPGAERRAQLALFNQLRQRLNPTPPSLRDVLTQVQDITQQYSTNVREMHQEMMAARVTQYNPRIEAQLYSEKLYPMTYLPCQPYLNKTFLVSAQDTARPDVDFKFFALNYDGEGSQDLLQLVGRKSVKGLMSAHLNQIMEYAKHLRVQHVILIDLTCASFNVEMKGPDVVLMPLEIQEAAKKRLLNYQLGGGKKSGAV